MQWYDVWIQTSQGKQFLMKVYSDGDITHGMIGFNAFQLPCGPVPAGGVPEQRINYASTPGGVLHGALPGAFKLSVSGNRFDVDLRGAVGDNDFELEFDVRLPLAPEQGATDKRVNVTIAFDAQFWTANDFLFSTVQIDGGQYQSNLGASTLRQLATSWRAHDNGSGNNAALFTRSNLTADAAKLNGIVCRRGLRCIELTGTQKGSGIHVFNMDVHYDAWHAGATNSMIRLWPLDLKPWDHRGLADLSIYSALDWSWNDTEEPTLQWGLIARSTSSPGVADFPAGADPRKAINAIYDSALDTRGGDSATAVPRFDCDNDRAGQMWQQEYSVVPVAPTSPGQPERYQLSFDGLKLMTTDRFVPFRVTVGNFRDQNGALIGRTFAMTNSADPRPEGDATRIQFSVRDATHDQGPVTMRIGALDLDLATDLPLPTTLAPDANRDGTLAITVHNAQNSEGGGRPVFDIDINLSLAVSSFSPGDQDLTPFDRTDPRAQNSIIVSMQRAVGTFVLSASENWYARHSHRLALQLSNIGTGARPSVHLVVLDPRPLLIARVDANVNSKEIGDWSTAAVDGPSWLLFDDPNDPSTTQLPPQGLGEDMIKRYVPTGDPFAAARPLRYQFSPTAVFKLSRSVFKQRFTEAPWNLRRLLGYPGQRLPGAGVQSLTFELLYGLQTTLTGRLLRLAALDARLGRVPPSVLDIVAGALTSDVKEYAQRYDDYLDILDSRLGILEPWSELQAGARLDTSEGVDYELRSNRHVAHPIDPTTASGIYSPSYVHGGVDWGFESNNVYNEVLSVPKSTSGRIVGPWFSALGGGGFQRASFAHDKSTIYSDAFLGRTFFYSVERLGRIGVLWNAAKHVIIYERTVMDSEQFPEGATPQWRGVPVVRKVREYVEILQKERAYPEFGESPKARGFILGSKFPEPIIPVDSAWGRDVPEGWMVPLYSPGAGPYYKRPTVALQLAAGDAKASNAAFAHVLNPENLVFFTSTRPGDGRDTNAWAAVPGVDFPFLSLPSVPSSSPAQPSDVQEPNPPAHERGYEPFTYAVDTANQAVNLLAGRVEQVTEALLDNVTMVRRNLDDALSGAVGDFSAIFSVVDAAHEHVNALVSKWLAGDVGAGEVQTIVDQELVAAIKNVQTVIDGVLAIGERANLINPAKRQDQFTSDLSARWDRVVQSVRTILQEAGDATPAGAIVDERALIDVLSQQVPLLRSLAMVNREASDAIARIRGLLSNEAAHLGTARARLRELLARTKVVLHAALDRARNDHDAAVYRAAILRELAAIHAAVEEDRRRIADLLPAGFAALCSRVDAAIAQGLYPLDIDFPTWLSKVSIDGPLDSIEAAYDEIVTAVSAIDPSESVRKVEAAFSDALSADAVRAIADRVKADGLSKLDGLMQAKRAEIRGLIEADLAPKAEAVAKVWGDLKTIADDVAPALKNVVALLGTVSKIAAHGHAVDADVKQAVEQSLRALGGSLLGGLRALLVPQQQRFLAAIRQEEEELHDRAAALADATLRLVRAYGNAPVAETMKLTRDKLAYYFHQFDPTSGRFVVRDVLDFTPSTVLMNRVGREIEQLDLKSMGIRLPSFSLGDRFLPSLPEQFNLSSLFPDFAGLNLSNLFSGLQLPSSLGDGVKITHGFNPATRRAWAQCDVSIQLARDTQVFLLGPVELRLSGAAFDATTRIEAGASGAPQRNVDARIHGDWHLIIVGQPIVTLKQTTIRFDNSGRLAFDLGAANVELNQALQFLTDLLKKFLPSNRSGLSIDLLREDGIPKGVQAQLNLALPALQSGAFSISNLALLTSVGLKMGSDGFQLAGAIGLASKERPFNLSVLFLGGGGWFAANALYKPSSGGLTAGISIGISAGASAPFDIGFASGSVSLLLSLGIEWSFGGSSAGLTILLRLALAGELNILGLVSISVLLSLEARYSDGALQCTGLLRVKIKIGWFIDIQVEQSLTLSLSPGQGGFGHLAALAAAPAGEDDDDARTAAQWAQAYVDALGGT